MKKRKKQIVFKQNCVKRFRIYPAFLYYKLDRWLKEMSLNGLHIVHCDAFFFWFEKGEPSKREYFTHGLVTQEKKYSITSLYPILLSRYSMKKSKINLNQEKTYQIVEIDTNKIDVENDLNYKQLVGDRNRLYKRYFIRNVSVCSIVVAVLIIINLLF